MPARDPRPHRAGRDVEHVGDLGVVEVAQVAQHHRDPELLGERARARRRRRAGFRHGPRSTVPRRPARGRLQGRRARAAPGAPQLVERRVGGHPVAPGGERGPAVEPADAARDRDHRLLGGVERVLRMADDASAHARGCGRRAGRGGPRAARRSPPDGACGEIGVAPVTQASPRSRGGSAWARRGCSRSRAAG